MARHETVYNKLQRSQCLSKHCLEAVHYSGDSWIRTEVITPYELAIAGLKIN